MTSSFLLFWKKGISLSDVTRPSSEPNILPKPNVINIRKNRRENNVGTGRWLIASVNATNASPEPPPPYNWKRMSLITINDYRAGKAEWRMFKLLNTVTDFLNIFWYLDWWKIELHRISSSSRALAKHMMIIFLMSKYYLIKFYRWLIARGLFIIFHKKPSSNY